MKYVAIFERAADGGYSAYVPDLPGCISAGDTLDEAENMIREAIAGHLEVMREFGDPIPPPSAVARQIEAA